MIRERMTDPREAVEMVMINSQLLHDFTMCFHLGAGPVGALTMASMSPVLTRQHRIGALKPARIAFSFSWKTSSQTRLHIERPGELETRRHRRKARATGKGARALQDRAAGGLGATQAA